MKGTGIGDGGDVGESGRIRTFPFPVDLSLSGVGMRVGPMDDRRTWHADAPWNGYTASTSTS